jgi:hypothetical protein
VAVARGIGGEGTTVHVVQIGGRTPERIPEVGADGKVVGYRADRSGKPLQTWLSADGEKQLGEIAAATPGGTIVRAERGTTGIDKISAQIRLDMKGELAERVETVFADIYYYPLGFAILLLLVEAAIGESALRVFSPRHAPPPKRLGPAAPAQLGGMPSFLIASDRDDEDSPFARKGKKGAATKERGEGRGGPPSRRTSSAKPLSASSRLRSHDREVEIEPDPDAKEAPRGKKS